MPPQHLDPPLRGGLTGLSLMSANRSLTEPRESATWHRSAVKEPSQRRRDRVPIDRPRFMTSTSTPSRPHAYAPAPGHHAHRPANRSPAGAQDSAPPAPTTSSEIDASRPRSRSRVASTQQLASGPSNRPAAALALHARRRISRAGHDGGIRSGSGMQRLVSSPCRDRREAMLRCCRCRRARLAVV